MQLSMEYTESVGISVYMPAEAQIVSGLVSAGACSPHWGTVDM